MDQLTLPLHLPLSIPWGGDEGDSSECGSACTPAADDVSSCDGFPSDSRDDYNVEEPVYQRIVDGAIVQPAMTVVMSSVSVAGTAFGSVANYFLPEVALGPPELAPPGRFHPVPTRPVFSRSE